MVVVFRTNRISQTTMSYKLIWEPRGVVICFEGSITIRDLLQATAAYQSDHRFDLLRYVIANYSAIDDCEIQVEDIDDVWVADVGSKYTNPNIKKAIVSTNPTVSELRDRYQHLLGTAYPTKLFTSEKDARIWLGTSNTQ